MNIIIPDSWLRDFLKTDAKPVQIAQVLSLCATSVDRVEKLKDDYLYHIEITTNRVDLASIFGLAREAVAVLPRFGHKAQLQNQPELDPNLKFKPQVNYLEVKIENPNLCPRFTAILLDNVTIKPSSLLIQKRLEKCGIRALNNVVDISNYVMLEMGQPMHTFDYDKILGPKMLMKLSKKGGSITTLDGSNRKLPEGSIIIEDGKGRIIDLCGIMGGENSAIDQNTKKVLLFVQTYDPMRIRQTCQKMAFRTDAASLFEKSLDPENVPLALIRAVEILEKESQAKTVKEIIDIYPHPYKTKTLKLDLKLVEKILGVEIPPKEITSILTSLSFYTLETIKHAPLSVTVPSFRSQDINIPEDLIEEIARLWGYHNLPTALPSGQPPQREEYDNYFWEEKTKKALKYWGFTETYTYSMVSQELIENYGLDPKKCLKIANPLTEDWVYMRPSLISSLLSVVVQNQYLKEEISLFELSNIYFPRKNDLPEEKIRLSGVLTGSKFLEVKGLVEALLEDLGIIDYLFLPYIMPHTPHPSPWHTGRSTAIKTKNYELGIMGELYPQVAERFGIKDRVTAFDLDFSLITKLATTTKKYHPIPKYPPVIEDLAVLADKKILTADLLEAIKSVSPLIVQVSLLDIYESTRTFRIIYQSANKTLENKEVRLIREKIIKVLEKTFSAQIKTAAAI